MERNQSIDALKLFAAFLVAYRHATYANAVEARIINELIRIAVPFFFMVSGYYAWTSEQMPKRKRMKTLFRHVKIWVGVNIIYTIIYLMIDRLEGNSSIWMLTSLTEKRWILFNYGYVSHMWFVRALIYLDIALLMFEKKIKEIMVHIDIKWVLILLWIMDVIVTKYSIILFGFSIAQPKNEIIHKYLGVVVLYYFMGYYFHSIKEKIDLFFQKIKLPYMIAIVLSFLMLNHIECFLLEKNGVNVMPINYLFSFPLSISYFLLGLEYQLFRKDSWLVWMGVNASMYIYYWHNLILQTEKSLLSSKVRIIYENPFLLFGQALILSCLIVFVKNNWKIGKKPDVIHD